MRAGFTANQSIAWRKGSIGGRFESGFEVLYAEEVWPALPVRRELLLLKQLRNLSDEGRGGAVDATLNPYFQFYCGEREVQWGALRRTFLRGVNGRALNLLLARRGKWRTFAISSPRVGIEPRSEDLKTDFRSSSNGVRIASS